MTLRNVHPWTAIIQKAQYVRVGLFPMISRVIVKSGEKFRVDPDIKAGPLPLPSPLPLPFIHWFLRCNVDYFMFMFMLNVLKNMVSKFKIRFWCLSMCI